MKSFFNTSSDDKETTRKLRGFPAISPSPLLSFRFFLFYRFISFESGSLIWSRDFLLDIWMNPWMFASFKGMMDLRSFMESSWQPGLNLAYHPNLVKVFPLSISWMSEEVTQQSVADVGVAWVGPRQLNYVSTPANRLIYWYSFFMFGLCCHVGHTWQHYGAPWCLIRSELSVPVGGTKQWASTKPKPLS